MPKKEHVTCDNCKKDLDYVSSAIHPYRLVLSDEHLPYKGNGAIPAVMTYPILEQDVYFCGLECLAQWASRFVRHPEE
jgi:hypothetical protein